MNSLVPAVTVSMATFNSQLTVSRAISSVLEQDFRNFELLVFDAQSIDRTPEILKKFAQQDPRVRLYLHERQHPWIASAQLGLQLASGEFFMFLDGDDYIATNYLSNLIEKIKVKSSVGAMGKLLHHDVDGHLLVGHPSFGREFQFASSEHRYQRLRNIILTPDRFGSVNILYSLWRISELREIGLWSTEKERRDDDYLFCLRALSKGRITTDSNTWISRSVDSYSGPRVRLREVSSHSISEFQRSHQDQLTDWTFPYVVQIARFIRSDLRNLIVLLPTLMRICIAIVALPKRYLQRVGSSRVLRTTEGKPMRG